MKETIILLIIMMMTCSCKESVIFDKVERAEEHVDHSGLMFKAGGGGNGSVFTTQTYVGALETEGLVNGSLSDARFDRPEGVAFDSNGDLYVTDRDNHCIRKISKGTVSIFAGSTSGISGFADGTGTAARFSRPIKLAFDSNDNLYVADRDNNAIRKITPAGVVTTLAGTGTAGFQDGAATNAKFNWPLDIVVSSEDVIYVADSRNDRIRKIFGGTVSTLAGSTAGYVDGATGAASKFENPSGLAFGVGGNLVVTDRSNNCLRRVLVSTGQTTTYAGQGGVVGYVDGADDKALFNEPFGIEITDNGTIYVADIGNHNIRMMRTEGANTVTTIGGNIAGWGTTEGDFAKFHTPTDIAIDDDGNLYIADLANEAIRKMSTTTRVLQKTYGWTATTVEIGLTWYRMEDVEYYQHHEAKIEEMNVNVLDLDPNYYKFYHHTVDRADATNTTGIASEITGAIAGVNGTYGNRGNSDTTHTDYDHHVSFAKRGGSIVVDSDGTPWDCGVTYLSKFWLHHEGEFHYDFTTDTYGTSRCNLGITDPYTYSPYTSYDNMFSGGPLLIEDYELAGLDTTHYATYDASDKYKVKMHIPLPRTAIAVTGDDHILLITVDGGNSSSPAGLSTMDLTRFLNTYFNPQYALNIDGGGSTTMVIEGYGDNGSVGDLGVVNWPMGKPEAEAYDRQRTTLTNALVVIER